MNTTRYCPRCGRSRTIEEIKRQPRYCDKCLKKLHEMFGNKFNW